MTAIEGRDAWRGAAGFEDERSFLKAYQARAAEVSLLMGTFFLRYLGSLYREFEGDLAMVIVLGEVGHHNVSHCYTGGGGSCRTRDDLLQKPDLWDNLHPCNAFSLSVATGIPRETVRRKINSLVAKGWLRRNMRGEVFMTPVMVRHFHSDFDPHLLREFLEVASRAEQLLRGAGESAKTGGPGQPPHSLARRSGTKGKEVGI